MNYEHYKKLKECAYAKDAEKWSDYKKEQETNNKHIDLRFSRLEYLSLRGFDLSNADLRFVRFVSVDLLGADVTKADVRSQFLQLFVFYATVFVIHSVCFFLIGMIEDIFWRKFFLVFIPSVFTFLLLRFKIGLHFMPSFISFLLFSISLGLFFQLSDETKVVSMGITMSTLLLWVTLNTGYRTGNAALVICILIAAGNLPSLFYRDAANNAPYYIQSSILLLLIATIVDDVFASKRTYKLLQWASHPEKAIGYEPPVDVDATFKEQEKQLRRKEKELFEAANQKEFDAVRENIEVLQSSIASQKSLYAKIDSVLFQFEKPNTYIRSLIRFNWWMLEFFVVLATLALMAIGYFEYGIYQKYWGAKPVTVSQSIPIITSKADSTSKSDSVAKMTSPVQTVSVDTPAADVPFWAYSPIIFAGVILGFAVTQINRRLKEINSLNEKRRFVEGVKSTLQAYNLTHNAEETEAQIKKIVEKLEGYYFQLQKEEDKESEESGSNALVEQLLNAFKGNGNP